MLAHQDLTLTKILIANRGEIACRIIRTAHQLGLSCVAVYSEADRDALHVKMADEAIAIGPAPARESYLRVDRILAAAKQTGAQAIHPGYGFLSENSELVAACQQAGLIFIGPPQAAIEAMGSKSAAKSIMEAAGVPLVPGYHGDQQEPEFLAAEAATIGYPVLLKAVAGGGGKGMRIVHQASEFVSALAAAQREARNAFGEDKMLVEKYLLQPRHVEVQVFCDQQGQGVYLFERDCSVQRRHQKIIEEAPAPHLSAELRQAMGEAALKAAQAIGYVGAGTVEFLLDARGEFFFMEMNTRLQVEHPITEMITGQDLVEWQLRIAIGQPLPLKQAELKIQGHAFEARIYAEDPEQDFLPATGCLSYLRQPAESRFVRVDTGVLEGDQISIYYDPMLAKLIVWGPDRQTALQRLIQALGEYRIAGLTTNIDFLQRLASSAPFHAGEVHTHFIEQHQALLFQPRAQAEDHTLALASLYALLRLAQERQQEAAGSLDPYSPWHAANGWRLNQPSQLPLRFALHDGSQMDIQAEQLSQHRPQWRLHWQEQQLLVEGRLEGDTLEVVINGHRQSVPFAALDTALTFFTADGILRCQWLRPDQQRHEYDEVANSLNAPMNGSIVTLLVAAGETVKKGEALMVMEAMKMEHTLHAPADGQVERFLYQAGDLVEQGAELVHFAASESAADAPASTQREETHP
ncbi:acetyl/propionyl/methylcrotonyl-CoA carboxylase subunit alpha [Marinospirillum sp. MEB164]|uniref:Acetyl/propionyl/methylcrotonyl-CoA carboxylase subunit alpha n=1 Tax=Marinospirillum alkalitolerans TaxID=3123374 RepID=A0ABW8PYD2_9GAMM